MTVLNKITILNQKPRRFYARVPRILDKNEVSVFRQFGFIEPHNAPEKVL
jgi:hypothetical protein